MNINQWYEKVWRQWPSRQDLLKIKNDPYEPPIDWAILQETDDLRLNQWEITPENLQYYGEFGERGEMIARTFVVRKLERVALKLARIHPEWALSVRETWRPLEIQQQQFDAEVAKLAWVEDEEERLDRAHNWIANPITAGHPTGGSVDVEIVDRQTGRSIGFGTDYRDLSTPESAMFAPTISKKAKRNRAILRALMNEEDFIQYEGEWWHYDFGNYEWAFRKGLSKSFYSAQNADGIRIQENNGILIIS